jgi:ferredoxin--NADP+ reductase
MYKIVTKKRLAPEITLFQVEAPLIARKALPGQFIILRIDEQGERIPLTIYEADETRGRITIIFQEVGKTTKKLSYLKIGDFLLDLLGPLGRPTAIERYGEVLSIGGGIGIIPLAPIVRALQKAGNRITTILGARTRDLVILEKEMKNLSQKIYVTTDDGSYGEKGLVTDVLERLMLKKKKIDLVLAVGPLIMMKKVCEITKREGIPTIVSLNTIMVDGTGMCGSCRVRVRKKNKFACVHGPEFPGELVDFDELLAREKRFAKEERIALERYEKELKDAHAPAEAREKDIKGSGENS